VFALCDAVEQVPWFRSRSTFFLSVAIRASTSRTCSRQASRNIAHFPNTSRGVSFSMSCAKRPSMSARGIDSPQLAQPRLEQGPWQRACVSVGQRNGPKREKPQLHDALVSLPLLRSRPRQISADLPDLRRARLQLEQLVTFFAANPATRHGKRSAELGRLAFDKRTDDNVRWRERARHVSHLPSRHTAFVINDSSAWLHVRCRRVSRTTGWRCASVDSTCFRCLRIEAMNHPQVFGETLSTPAFFPAHDALSVDSLHLTVT
jgi:hypothetical protein